MNIVLVNYTVQDKIFDYAWLSFKTYVEENYKGSMKWNWPFPINDSKANDAEELVERILALDPVVVGFSLYVWNVGLSRHVAKRIKELRPDIYIVFGGPYCEYKEDPDYFKKLPFIDFTCQTDGYGEPFINELLYQIETDKDWSKVPFMVLPDEKNGYKLAGPTYAKKSFVWPKKIFERNEDYLKAVAAEKSDTILMTIYETHRGCPYSCSFCEWSGGINSKVSFKPTEDILDDMNFMVRNGYLYNLHLVEANLGQLDRDVEIIRHLCEMKKTYGLPILITPAGLSKSKKRNVYMIDELTAEAGLKSEFKISIQDLDQGILNNINRVDEPWENQYSAYSKMRDTYGYRIRADLIRGLPGSTVDKYYETAEIMIQSDVFWERYAWHLLPTSPASDPVYMDKFKIEAIDAPMAPAQGGAYHSKFVGDTGFANIHGLVSDPAYAKLPKIVVATSSYTREDYVEMMVLDGIIVTMETERYLSRLTRYLKNNKGITYGKFYRTFYHNIHKYLNPIQSSILNGIILQAHEKVQGKSNVDFEYYRLENLPWDIYGKIPTLLNVMININRARFYDAIKQFVFAEFGEDDKIEDLINWMINSVKWIDYDPTNVIPFVSEYDWTKEESERSKYLNTPLDTVYSREDWLIDWHTYPIDQRINKYFIMLCSLHGTEKIFKQMRVEKC